MANNTSQALTDMRSNFPDNFFSTVPNGKIKYQRGIVFNDISTSNTAKTERINDNTPGEVNTNIAFSKFISVTNPTYDTSSGGKVMLCYSPDAINYQRDNNGEITDARVNRRFFFPGVAYLKVSPDGSSLTSAGGARAITPPPTTTVVSARNLNASLGGGTSSGGGSSSGGG